MTASWIKSANTPGCDFPLDNLPLGVKRPGRICTAIGDQVLDLHGCAEIGLVGRECQERWLNALMPRAGSLRAQLTALLANDAVKRPPEKLFSPLATCEMMLPVQIGDYTDFYASLHHASNVGKVFRPDNPLPSNYRHMPIGYHGRASSIVVSGTALKRPAGQLREGVFGLTERLDYEMELGAIIGQGNAMGDPVPIDTADDHIFGFCLVNDWSARDIQRWEYQPLGPFLSKSFATSIAPWIVTSEALAPYRGAAPDHETLPYLRAEGGLYDITLEVYVKGELMGRSNAGELYWTFGQMIVHHTSNGCNLRRGDLLASGTISGEAADARGCLLEMAANFLSDGEEVVMRGYAERPGLPRIGFGECRGVVNR